MGGVKVVDDDHPTGDVTGDDPKDAAQEGIDGQVGNHSCGQLVLELVAQADGKVDLKDF